MNRVTFCHMILPLGRRHLGRQEPLLLWIPTIKRE